jgi:hypothetical protein
MAFAPSASKPMPAAEVRLLDSARPVETRSPRCPSPVSTTCRLATDTDHLALHRTQIHLKFTQKFPGRPHPHRGPRSQRLRLLEGSAERKS